MKWPKLNERVLRAVLELCSTFFLDASVLTFVFPVLDTIVERGRRSLTSALFVGTLAISGVFFVGSIIAAVLVAVREES